MGRSKYSKCIKCGQRLASECGEKYNGNILYACNHCRAMYELDGEGKEVVE